MGVSSSNNSGGIFQRFTAHFNNNDMMNVGANPETNYEFRLRINSNLSAAHATSPSNSTPLTPPFLRERPVVPK